MVLYVYAWALHCVLAVWASIRDIAYRGDIESKAYTEVSKKERKKENLCMVPRDKSLRATLGPP